MKLILENETLDSLCEWAIPHDFLLQDVSLAIHIGISAVREIKRETPTNVSTAQEQLMQTMKQLCATTTSGRVAEMEDENRRLHDQCLHEKNLAATIDERLKNEHAVKLAEIQLTLTSEASVQQSLLLKESRQDSERARSDLLEERSVHNTTMSMKHVEIRDMQKKCEHRVELAQAEVRTLHDKNSSLQDEIGKLRIPAIRGNTAETDVLESMNGYGLYAVNTSKGCHNTRFHDLLVSNRTLRTENIDDGGLRYIQHGQDTELARTIRCSVEMKKYNKSNSMTEQIQAFINIRTKMLEYNRADCFVFVASVNIPGKPRVSFEMCRDENGCDHLTCYFGASDMTLQEITQLVFSIIHFQLHIHTSVPLHGVPENELLFDLTKIAHGFLRNLAKSVKGADAAIKLAGETLALVRKNRHELVEDLLCTQLKLRRKNHTTFKPDTLIEVDAAIDSIINGSCRVRTCKLIPTKDEYTKFAASFATLTDEPDEDQASKRQREL